MENLINFYKVAVQKEDNWLFQLLIEAGSMKEILEVTAMSIEWMIEEGESIPGGRG